MSSKLRRTTAAGVVAGLTVTAALTLAPSAPADPVVPSSPEVVVTWSNIAAATIYPSTPVPSSSLYFGFVSLAVYDAVAAIDGGYETYLPQPRPHAHASPEVAAATAAYEVLRHYFPASSAALGAAYADQMAGVKNGVAKVHGARVGRAAAERLVAARVGDGIGADIRLDVPEEPGVWRPTPDAFAPMAVPWLGFVEPLVIDSPTQFGPPGPDPIGSAAYAADFAEVRDYGARDGSSRSEEQTRTALFWAPNVILQYHGMLAGLASGRDLDILETARLFAVADASTADALISCWRAKYDEAYWRPVTAIREADTDGNAATQPDEGWAPLLATPPYPDYTSGHACVTGAVTGTVGHLIGTTSLDLRVVSPTGAVRTYDTTAALDAESMDGRIWLGFHFRKAMTDGNRLGHDVADWVVEHQLRPSG